MIFTSNWRVPSLWVMSQATLYHSYSSSVVSVAKWNGNEFFLLSLFCRVTTTGLPCLAERTEDNDRKMVLKLVWHTPAQFECPYVIYSWVPKFTSPWFLVSDWKTFPKYYRKWASSYLYYQVKNCKKMEKIRNEKQERVIRPEKSAHLHYSVSFWFLCNTWY